MIELTATGVGVTSITFIERVTGSNDSSPILEAAATQLTEYFAGNRTSFDLPLAPEGTEFQRRVWSELRTIPFGETVSYLDIARSLGDTNAIRAVGAANGKNPIAIVVPCHRVIGSDGKLTGYAGGLWRKEWLLRYEGVAVGTMLY
jgi:methylated-DNA-[protein]-cysteine S-methyltransferase